MTSRRAGRCCRSSASREDLDERSFDADLVLDRLAYDRDSPIWASLEGARENARTVREVISSEMWLCLNTTYNALPGQQARARRGSPTTYFNFVKERAALVSGLVDGTMSHDDGWRFLVLGRSRRTRRHDRAGAVALPGGG